MEANAAIPAAPDAVGSMIPVVGEAVTKGADGSPYAVLIVIIFTAAALAALWIWRNTGPDKPDDGGDGCKSTGPDGCPAVQVLASRVEALTRQIETNHEVDREERREYRAEVGGTVFNGWPVATDRDSQAKTSAAYTLARDGHWPAEGGWKFGDGVYRALTADQVMAMALAVSVHVQGCFAREAALMADPEADVRSGWPA
jgi:hypothetical protein